MRGYRAEHNRLTSLYNDIVVGNPDGRRHDPGAEWLTTWPAVS
jgi:hypothetical protein